LENLNMCVKPTGLHPHKPIHLSKVSRIDVDRSFVDSFCQGRLYPQN